MGICAKEFRELVIRPVLAHLKVEEQASPVAENLLLGTAATESGLGFHLKLKKSLGIGIYQITPKSHQSVWDDYLIDYPELASSVRGLASQQEFLARPHAELATNLSYATAIAWMIFRKANESLPDADDITQLGCYWAKHFHPNIPAAPESFTRHYYDFITSGKNDVAA